MWFCIKIDLSLKFDPRDLNRQVAEFYAYMNYRRIMDLPYALKAIGLKEIGTRLAEWEYIFGIGSDSRELITYSEHFSFGMFFFFLIQTTLGFVFVNYITLKNARKNVFYSLNEEYSAFNPYILAKKNYFNEVIVNKNLRLNTLYKSFYDVLQRSSLLYLFFCSTVLRHHYSIYAVCRD